MPKPRCSKAASALLAALLITGCGESADPGDPGAPAADEARALDDAAAMLDEQRLAAPPETPTDPAPSGDPGN